MLLFPRLLAIVALLCASAPALAQDLIPSAPPTQETVEAPAAPVALESPDQEIGERLRGLFGDIQGLENVAVGVRGGVVVLRGVTLTAADKRKAEDIAGRLAGVVSVENEIVVEHRVERRLEPLVDKAREVGRSALAFLPLLLIALVTFLAFWFAGGLLTRSTRLYRRLAPNPFIERLLEQGTRVAFLLTGLITAMAMLGATALLGSVLGAAGLFGLAVGFAVRDTIENYIASVLLSIRQPFAPNDHVVIEGYEGRITRLNSRATVMTTLDGNEVRIPNATVYKAIITNFTRLPERRFEFEVGVGYENQLSTALAIALQATCAAPGVLSDPAPSVLVQRLDAYSVAITVLGWVDQSHSDFMKVRSETIRQVKEAFEAAGVSMPEPIQNVRRLPDAAPAPKARRLRRPEDQEIEAATDTRADPTIPQKVEALRASGEEDLLAPHAPRE